MNVQMENKNAKITDMVLPYYSVEQVLLVHFTTYLIKNKRFTHHRDVDTLIMEGIHKHRRKEAKNARMLIHLNWKLLFSFAPDINVDSKILRQTIYKVNYL